MSADHDHVEAIVTEVTNTPWGERHAYVLRRADERSGVLAASFDKALHVSPFMPMDHTYTARASAPGATLSVHIESRRAGVEVFDATLSLARRELTRHTVRRMTLCYPLARVRVPVLIYAHALGLKLAGARVYRHPGARAA
jgi:DUF1365 family protein